MSNPPNPVVSASASTGVPSEPILIARDLSKIYHDGTRQLEVLDGADLTVSPGEIISIVGASGVGKSTLLHLLGALDKPSRGTISLHGQQLQNLDGRQMASVRARSIGFIFQFHHLLSEFTALENVMIPGMILGESTDTLKSRAVERLKLLGLEDRMEHRPVKLSGGEQQRVALARALVNNPDMILADEPTGNLDTDTAETVINLLWNNVRENHKCLVIVTHDQDIARRADRCLRLRDKKLVPEE
jgi:lipoprotein-releasing system ATP-binding protein